jgi:hypothetical protein
MDAEIIRSTFILSQPHELLKSKTKEKEKKENPSEAPTNTS